MNREGSPYLLPGIPARATLVGRDPAMRYAYYHRLSRRQQAIYRHSDAADVALPDPRHHAAQVAAVFDALALGDRRAVERASRRLTSGLCRAFGVPGVTVRILSRRPASASAELHGLYERVEDERPVIRVWMRTAARGRVVAPRTFLRTLLHEVCHHLDYELFELADSFHTEGFFRREASLARQLLEVAPTRRRVRKAEAARSPRRMAAAAVAQLELPLARRRSR